VRTVATVAIDDRATTIVVALVRRFRSL